MRMNITRCPVQGIHIDALKESCADDIDSMPPHEAVAWLENLLKDPEGCKILLRYLFYKVHQK